MIIVMPTRWLFIIVTAFLVISAQAEAQDRMVLGPRQMEADRGAGAVLCAWAIAFSIQAQTAECKLPRRPVDDAIDESIRAMEAFIIANSSLHPTQAMIDNFKRGMVEGELSMLRRQGMEKICAGRDLEMFRRPSAEQVRASTKALLAEPREPVMNPCL